MTEVTRVAMTNFKFSRFTIQKVLKNISEHLIWEGYMVIPVTMHGDQEAWMPS